MKKNFKTLDTKLKKLVPRHIMVIGDLGKQEADSIYGHYKNGKNGKYEIEIRVDEDNSKKYAVSFKPKQENKNA